MGKIKAGRINPLPVVPVVLVGSNVEGKPNFATAGFVSGANIGPWIVSVSLNRHHHTPKGILENGSFSINVPSAAQVVKSDFCGLVSGKIADKSGLFTTFYGELGTAPMIEEFPIVCECGYTGRSVEFETDIVYFGEICQVYVNEELIPDGRTIDVMKTDPLVLGSDTMYRTLGAEVGRAYAVGWNLMKEGGIAQPDVFGAAYDCRLVERPAVPTLTVRYRPDSGNPQEMFRRALSAVLGHAGLSGAFPSGAPFTAYFGANGRDAELETGFTFDRRLEGGDGIVAGEIPAGRYASCVHTGPYDLLGNARAALHAWMRLNGYEGAGASYEFYLGDPMKTPPDRLEAQIVVPLK